MDVIIETTNSGVVELAASDTEKFVPHPRNGGLGAESSVGEWSEWLMFLWVDGLSLQLHSKKGTSIYAIHIKCCWNQHTNPTTSPSPSFVSILSLLSEDIIFGGDEKLNSKLVVVCDPPVNISSCRTILLFSPT